LGAKRFILKKLTFAILEISAVLRKKFKLSYEKIEWMVTLEIITIESKMKRHNDTQITI